jgi:hypothetical protein
VRVVAEALAFRPVGAGSQKRAALAVLVAIRSEWRRCGLAMSPIAFELMVITTARAARPVRRAVWRRREGVIPPPSAAFAET